ncbi:MAG: CARDB domain-containing protein, partial [Thermoplasmatota archaeon]
MTVSMYGSIGGLSPDAPPDIEMVSLMAEPDPEGDFDISMIVKNRGGEISDECESIFWDETDIITGNRTLIGQMMIPPIEPGKEYEVRLKWDPRTSDPHRIWGVVDPDSDILEASKSNNIGSILVQMPKVKSVRTTIDGNPDAKIIGDLITGVPFDLPLTVEMDLPVNPSLMKIYIEMEDGSQVFVPFQADQTFRKSIDATVFSKGDNNITVNASYALIGSEPVTYLVRTRELPYFLSNLIDLQVDFIPQGPYYEASGYLDIPDLAMILPLDGISEGVEVSVFSGTRDVFVTANIMLDGAATLLFDGSPIFSVPGGGSISDISS